MTNTSHDSFGSKILDVQFTWQIAGITGFQELKRGIIRTHKRLSRIDQVRGIKNSPSEITK